MKFKELLLALLLLIGFSSHQAKAQSLVDQIDHNHDLTQLGFLVSVSDFIDALSAGGPYTIFAPTNHAFGELTEDFIEELVNDSDALTNFLLYHVAHGTYTAHDFHDGQQIEMLNGEFVDVTVNHDGIFINESKIIWSTHPNDFGIIHLIDQVLIPPAPMPETVVEIIVNSDVHNTLEAAVIAAELADDLSGEGPFTVFAPTDDAFASLPEGTVEALLEDPTGDLAQILLYHVAGAKAFSGDLSDGQMIMTLNGADVTVTINDHGIFINDAMVTVADIEAGNGVVHVIDGVLLPPVPMPETVVEIIVNSDVHNTLEAAVIAAELADDLSGEGPFTVFAPTDDAFAALPEGTVESLLEDPTGDLAQILLYHVAGAKAFSGDLSDGQMIMTLNGADVTVTINDHGIFINDAMVTVADIEAGNGVVHVIDGVLLPPVPMPETVVEIIVNSDVHNTLEAAVIAAELADDLSGEGPFTVFAPTDDAFAALPEGTVESLLEDPTGDLAQILLYHVAGAKAFSGDLSDGQMIMTLNGADVTVTINDHGIFINDAMVTVADIEAGNGVVHVINAVLLPPVPMPETVVDIIVNSDVHNTLEAAVIAAELADDLSGEGPFTVFAPTDDAFAALPEGTVEALLEDPTGDLAQILLYHVAGAKAFSGDLSDGQMIMTLNGAEVTVSIMDGKVYINDAMVTVADIEAGNGVVHVINAVLLPPAPMPETVVEIIVNSDVHNTLEAAVIAAELADDLSGEGPFTVFAPTDDAFAALPEGTVEALLEDPTGDLAQILLYHVAGGKAFSGDLSDGQMIMTLNGAEVTVSIMNGKVYINDAMVTVADIEAGNGVVHVINAVLLPPVPMPETVVDIIVNSDVHNTLEAAVIAAELADDLSGEGPFTVFAPTDDAFAALPEGTVEALLEDPTGALADILLYHVAGAKAFSGDLSDGQMILTLNGQKVTVSIMDGKVYINDAMVTIADIEAGNGVVHVINAVLIPSADVQLTESADYGSILTDNDGNTLYFFTKDADGNSLCTDGCLNNWPVFYAGYISVGEGLDISDFASIDRGDGTMQTTYKGWPLYYFAGDNASGETNGEGAGNKWYVAKPDYTIMLVDDQLTGLDGVNYKSDYTPGDEIVQYFTDDKGNTLYIFINDFKDDNNFTSEDFSNNGIWPIYEEDGIIIPSTLNKADFGTTDVFGKNQMTYKGWPLYFFGQDMNRGENKGVSVPVPGVWPVAQESLQPAINKTVVDIIVNSDVHNTLEAAVIAAELADDLSGEGPFTVFAPTDDAFAALPEGTVEALLEDPTGDLAQILLYHVAGGKVFSGDLSDGQMIMTLNGAEVTVTINDDGIFINDAMVTVADIEAGNGVVHVIDGVLLPPVPMPETVVEIIVNSDVHNTLEAAVIAAELADDLSGEGPFTVFAPTDDAFAALPEGTVEALLEDPTGDLAQILLYHVAGGKVFSGDLSDGQMIMTLNGAEVTVSIMDGKVYINDAMVTVADIEAGNGVVHVINAVLLPPVPMPETVVDIIVNSDVHNTLEAAVIAAELADDLSGEGPFTVFAPTDDAFAALPEGTVEALLEDPTGDLAQILLYHVAGAKKFAGDLYDGKMIMTLNGAEVTVSIMDGKVYINDAMVTVADIEAGNGVVHVINAVLLPPVPMPETVVDIIVNSDVHNTLEAAVIAAELTDDLSGEGPFTVFAPTDDAFAALPEGTVEALLEDPTGDLANILLYHVAGVKRLSSDLYDGKMIETLFGEDVTVSIMDDKVYINNAMVTLADIEAKNGVVHVIDAVLLPSVPAPTTVVDIIVNSAAHTILETAVIAAELDDDLSGAGPFTVFAPTDSAFAALPEGTVEALLEDPTGDLAQILLYHVAGAKAFSGDLSDGQMIMTLNGAEVTVTINDDGIFINNAMVTVADIEAGNGVVHVIDAVLLPPTPEPYTVFHVIAESENHTILEDAIIAAELDDELRGEGPFTVFAPTDAAFAALPEGTVEALLEDPTGDLADILLIHVLVGAAWSADLNNGQIITTLNGVQVTVDIDEDGVYVDGAKVSITDIEADNGIVHVIDAVILPKSTTSIASVDFTEESLQIYPVPASNFVSVQLSTDVSDVQVQIIDMSGSVQWSEMYNFTSAGEETIDVSELREGYYIMRISNNSTVISKQLIITR